MTDGAKATVWEAEWSPWGAPLSITASPEMNQRFPGQWYQLEAGLHYNWHRHYDPSLGRYTQPDPLGFVDGPSVFAYARSNPQGLVDSDGRNTITLGGGIGGAVGGPPGAAVGAGIGAGVTLFCLINPSACKQAAQMCYRALGGGGGGSNEPGDKCDEQYEDDMDICKSLGVRKHFRVCEAQAMQRLGNCLAGKGLGNPRLGYGRR